MVETDLVIVGGGLAGLTAGLRARELNARVCILEQGEDQAYPCNSRFAGGIVHIAYNDPKNPPDKIMQSITAATSGEFDSAQAESLSTHGGRVLDWLVSHGAKFIRFSNIDWHRWCMAPPRPLGYGLDWKGRGPDAMLRNLTQQFISRGGVLELGTKATNIALAERRATVSANRMGTATEYQARAVIIADGGFQANDELFRKYIGPRPDLVCQRNARTGRGDGLQMAEKLGGAIVRTHRFYGHLLCRDAVSNPNLWPYPQLDELVASTLVVGPDGQRFIDEGSGGIALANQLAAMTDPARGTVIIDRTIWEGTGRSGRIPANPHLERAGATIHQANNLGELAAKAGIDAAGLEKTIASWNAAVENGQFDKLTPPRTAKTPPGKLENMKPWPIKAAPYMAIPMCPGITHTMGGILVDGEGRVLREDRSVIDGLFAAGSTTGGIEGGGEVGYIGGLSKASILGVRAAEAAVQLIHR